MAIDPNVAEIWSLYAAATIIIGLRVFCRSRMVGVSGFRPDDYLIFLAWALYTTVSVMATLFALVAQGRHTSILTPEQRATMPESEFYIWEYGSKNFLVGMSVYAAVVWTLKFNMLFFYRRLVAGQWVEKFILPVMALVASTAIAMILIIALTCRPFNQMWQVRPDPGANCVPQNKVYFYSILAMNVTTDTCILLIPIPVCLYGRLFQHVTDSGGQVISLVRASIWRRLGVFFLFSLGIFVIACAIIRVVLTFHPTGQFGPAAMWSIREDFVAIFIGQAPMIVPMSKKRFWQKAKTRFTPKSSLGSEGHELSNGVSNQKKPKDPYSLTQMGFTHITNVTNITRATQVEATLVDSGSQERIAVAEQGPTPIECAQLTDTESGNQGSSSLDITPVHRLPRSDTGRPFSEMVVV
ncbi:hypothetical protein CMUS01_12493 [Colletotrichum musicola]|uniref:Rhodopsin domain-containing protein n=1 Tax=Colletotrichum musicola TaxID=2175873 RepID=A0A8H6N0Q6_9PEZI|nr:hypothetical protein CMUS01_12493 [Colletotrichum musicola]